MKVVEITFSVDKLRAFIVLKPNWLERLFGARASAVTLVKDPHDIKTDIDRVWKSEHTGRRLIDLAHGSLIRDALEHVPLMMTTLPKAQLQ